MVLGDSRFSFQSMGLLVIRVRAESPNGYDRSGIPVLWNVEYGRRGRSTGFFVERFNILSLCPGEWVPFHGIDNVIDMMRVCKFGHVF